MASMPFKLTMSLTWIVIPGPGRVNSHPADLGATIIMMTPMCQWRPAMVPPLILLLLP
jgi:hypothetical protein